MEQKAPDECHKMLCSYVVFYVLSLLNDDLCDLCKGLIMEKDSPGTLLQQPLGSKCLKVD